MFEVKVGGLDQLLKKFDTFGEHVAELHNTMPEELVTWQREDMHRKFPNMTTDVSGDETSATTLIWPQSRLELEEEQARRQSQRGPKTYRVASAALKQQRIGKAAPKVHRGPLTQSTRPILRDELKDDLHDRITKLTQEAMKWP